MGEAKLPLAMAGLGLIYEFEFVVQPRLPEPNGYPVRSNDSNSLNRFSKFDPA
jgi:hypothetical protein